MDTAQSVDVEDAKARRARPETAMRRKESNPKI